MGPQNHIAGQVSLVALPGSVRPDAYCHPALDLLSSWLQVPRTVDVVRHVPNG
jgi:hypothetical protein